MEAKTKGADKDTDKKDTADERPVTERSVTDWPFGYPQYAALIASDKDKSTTVYRQFDRLAARNLLYLETELAELEARQDSLDKEGDQGFCLWSLSRLREEIGPLQTATEAQKDAEAGTPLDS